jgi:hypothetical protein
MKTLITTILALLSCFVLIVAFVLLGWFEVYKQTSMLVEKDQPAHFDLFIAETFFNETQSNSPFDSIEVSQRRPVEWLFNSEDFETLDSINMGDIFGLCKSLKLVKH